MPKHFVYEKLISKETLTKLYIDENKTKKEISILTGIKERTLTRIIEKYELVKSKEKSIEAMKRTNMVKYGCEFANQNDAVKEKRKATNVAKYGVEYTLQNKDIRNKIKETNLLKYGCENVFQNEEIKQKIQQTNLNKYGARYASMTDEYKRLISNKATETILNKYGVTNVAVLPEIKEKIKQTNLEKYGGSFLSTEEGKSHFRQIMLEKYGVDHPMKNDEIAKKASENHKNTMIEKYGYLSILSIGHSNNAYNIMNDDKLFIKYIKDNQNKPITEIAESLGYSYSLVQQKILKLNLKEYVDFNPQYSSYEKDIVDYLTEIGVKNINRNYRILDGKEIDIYIPDKNIGIEFNGNYWHSDAIKQKNYHQKKSLLAEKHGIRLIHIYEYEWNFMKDKIKSLLRIACGCVDKKIYARKCEVKKISNKEAKIFNDANHIQSHRNAQVTYGLFYNDKLVQLMSFSKHNKYEWEIIRGCPGSNNIVIGGVGKLFETFKKEYQPKEIFSYCDFNKFDGRSYEAIGMKFLGLTGPDKTYIVNKQGVKRNPRRKKELDENSTCVIWGSGSKKYLWKAE